MSIVKPTYKAGQTVNKKLSISSGIFASYLLNEGSGITVHDNAGANNLSFGGTTPPTWTTGVYGAPGVSFPVLPANSSLATVISGLVLPISYMVSFYVRVIGTNTPIDLGANNNILDIFSGAFYVYSGSNLTVTGIIPTANVQYIAVITVDVNGNCVATINGISGSGPIGKQNPTAISLGSYNSGGGQDLNGVLDATTIWNRVLTPAEIAQLTLDPFAPYRSNAHQLFFKTI